VNCAPHNYYSTSRRSSAQWCAAIPNARILEYDVDDVPWRDEPSPPSRHLRGIAISPGQVSTNEEVLESTGRVLIVLGL
jgi:hypothetical protein